MEAFVGRARVELERPENMTAAVPSIAWLSSRRRRLRLCAWQCRATQTARSRRSYSSAPARSSTTCTKAFRKLGVRIQHAESGAHRPGGCQNGHAARHHSGPDSSALALIDIPERGADPGHLHARPPSGESGRRGVGPRRPGARQARVMQISMAVVLQPHRVQQPVDFTLHNLERQAVQRPQDSSEVLHQANQRGSPVKAISPTSRQGRLLKMLEVGNGSRRCGRPR